MSKEALLIIDMLNDFVFEGAPLEVAETRKIISTIKKEIQKARDAGSKVIYVCDAHDKGDKEFSRFGWPAHAVAGTRGAEVLNDLQPEKDDIIIKKTTYSGFYKTELDETLKKLGVSSLILT